MLKQMTCRVSAAALVLALGYGGTSFAADVGAPPESVSPFSFQLEGWGAADFMVNPEENVEPDGDPNNFDFLVFGVDAKMRLNLGDNFAMQLDGAIDDSSKQGGDDYYEGGWQGLAHLSWYNQDAGLLGIMGGVGEGRSDGDNDDSEFWLLGAEGQLYLDSATFYLQAGYFDAEQENDSDGAIHDAWFVRGVGRYFVSPNTRLQAEASYLSGELDSDDDDVEVIGWGLRADHQFSEMVSLFVGYDGAYFESVDSSSAADYGEYTEHVVKAGVTIQLGRPDLLSADRSGPTLDLPHARRWAGAGTILD